jgi:hypothetical protein
MFKGRVPNVVQYEILRRWTNWQQLLEDRSYLNYLERHEIIDSIPDACDFDAFLNSAQPDDPGRQGQEQACLGARPGECRRTSG